MLQKCELVYKVRYRNALDDGIVYTESQPKPIVVESKGSQEVYVLELITDVHTNASLKENEHLTEPPQSVFDVETSILQINSPAIINALQKVVEYYPAVDFSQEPFLVPEPFKVFIHHENELAALRETYASSEDTGGQEQCIREKDTYEHIGLLQQFLKQRLGNSLESERLRHQRGYATFDMLWLLLKPGITVFCDTLSDGNYDAYVLHSVTGGEIKGRNTKLEITMWYLNYNGDYIGKEDTTKFQKPFNGEKDISTLEVFPCEFWKGEAAERNKDLENSLIERGKLFLKLASRCCMSYDGLTRTFPRTHVSNFLFSTRSILTFLICFSAA